MNSILPVKVEIRFFYYGDWPLLVGSRESIERDSVISGYVCGVRLNGLIPRSVTFEIEILFILLRISIVRV